MKPLKAVDTAHLDAAPPAQVFSPVVLWKRRRVVTQLSFPVQNRTADDNFWEHLKGLRSEKLMIYNNLRGSNVTIL
jgi:hypothetical protein